MNWQHALGECAHLMRELHEARDAGQPVDAFKCVVSSRRKFKPGGDK